MSCTARKSKSFLELNLSRLTMPTIGCAILMPIWGRIGAAEGLTNVDELIAATALAYGLTVVTRNVRDFEWSGVKLMNPWL